MPVNDNDGKNFNQTNGGGQRSRDNNNNSHSRSSTASSSSTRSGNVSTSSDTTADSSSSSSSSSSKEEADIKNLQVLFGALLQYDRFNNEKNFSTTTRTRSPSQKVSDMQTTQSTTTTTTAAVASHAQSQKKEESKVLVEVEVDKKQQDESLLETTTTTITTNQKYAAAAAKSLATFLCPPNQEIKETNLYQSTFRLLQWQRDNYMVGLDFANWRRDERVKEQRELQQQQQAAAVAATAAAPAARNGNIRLTPIMKPTFTYREMMQQLPHYNDAATIRQALGPIHLANIAKDFIPSTTVRQVALPLIVALPAGPGGPLYPMTQSSLVALILGQQDNMNAIMKSAILSVLDNPDYRRAMKKSTKGYMMVSNKQQPHE